MLSTISLLILCLAAQAENASSITVTVRTTSEVAGRVFSLGEIAEIKGSDASLVKQLASVEVGTSPLPGLSRPLAPRDILARLRLSRIDMKRIALVCPSSVLVMRKGQELAAEEIIRVAAGVLESTESRSEGCPTSYTYEPLPLPARLFIPAGKREYQPGAPRVQAANALVPVTVLVDGTPAKTVEVAFKVRQTVQALVATKTLEAHTVLTADDVSVARVELPPGASIPLTDAQAVIGKRTTRRILQGQTLPVNAVENVPVIAAGAKVTAEVVVGGVRITAPAIARTAGAVGDRIRVFVTDTKKELQGI
ncbi:MAG TPA: flagellar basal body P-ring formation chaperone FlgA, partial [Chthonomonadales bacterium]|nr:flagellar basal body P-ring formation chaperone FlgA [Chthonomonadales bacterium]